MAINATDEYLESILQVHELLGRDKAADIFGIEQDSIRRYLGEAKDRGITASTARKARLANELVDSYTQDELSAILKSGAQVRDRHTFRYDIGGHGRIKLAVLSDPHIGHHCFEEDIWDAAIDLCHREDIDLALMPGDLHEGMSNRPGHVYELTDIGYDAQKERSRAKLKESGLNWKIIDGNHDRWFIKSAGAVICKDVAESLNNVEFLGHDQADVVIDGLTIRMVHGEDGSSYALSYRMQKFVEAMHQQDDVPELAIFAHAHKQGTNSYMGVECLSAGALQSTTPWMRSKRNYSTLGFTILEIEHDQGTVHEFTHRWFPADRLLRKLVT